MVAKLDQMRGAAAFQRTVSWRGRSGRAYPLTMHRLDDFLLAPGTLYVVANGAMVLWVGTDADVINDQQSRARFRLALDCADRAFSLACPADEVEKMTLIWDLEAADPEPGLSAA
jgi:hypothetical protein